MDQNAKATPVEKVPEAVKPDAPKVLKAKKNVPKNAVNNNTRPIHTAKWNASTVITNEDRKRVKPLPATKARFRGHEKVQKKGDDRMPEDIMKKIRPITLQAPQIKKGTPVITVKKALGQSTDDGDRPEDEEPDESIAEMVDTFYKKRQSNVDEQKEDPLIDPPLDAGKKSVVNAEHEDDGPKKFDLPIEDFPPLSAGWKKTFFGADSTPEKQSSRWYWNKKTKLGSVPPPSGGN